MTSRNVKESKKSKWVDQKLHTNEQLGVTESVVQTDGDL